MTGTHGSKALRRTAANILGFSGKYKTISAAARYLFAVLAIVTMGACGGGEGGDGIVAPPAPPPAPTTTSYSLQQVNGQTLPATFSTTDGTIVVTSGTLDLRTDLAFAESILYTFAAPGGTAAADTAITTGTYSQTGTDITFVVPAAGSSPASTFSGTLSGNTLTYNDAGFVAVYRR